MVQGKRIVCAQLRVGDTDLPTYRLSDIVAKIDAAQKFAGMNRLIFLPSHNPSINKSIIRHCRKRGLEVYLWYKVLTDNDIMVDREEQIEDAFGRRGAGETALWRPIFDTEEVFDFGCPTNEKYNNLLLENCRKRLTAEYDGLFVDYVGYPLASLGLESLFTCFCESCREREPRLEEWRVRMKEMRDRVACWTDEDLEEVGSHQGLLRKFGLDDFYTYRTSLITALAGRYAALARELDKGVGCDVVSPALALFAGHDFKALGATMDFLKPRIYCNTYGPSSLPLEYYCMGMGTMNWAKMLSMPAVMEYVGNSTGLDVRNLAQMHFPNESARHEILRAFEMTTTQVFPGIECSLHPDYETFLDEKTVAVYVDACKGSPGLVMSWNLLFIPDVFLKLVGKFGHAG